MITRKDYLENSAGLHYAYYEQFVTPGIMNLVIQTFSIPRIIDAYVKDENFNTLPLSQWDMLTHYIPISVKQELKKAGDFYTLAGGVCIVKEAGRLIAEKEMNLQMDRMTGGVQ